MNNKLTKDEREHLHAIKSMSCGLCGSPPPVEAHHISQGLQYTTIPLCIPCHRGPQGWHGDRSLWKVYKITPLQVLNETVRRVVS